MRPRNVVVISTLVLLATSTTVRAEQSTVELTPKFAAGKPLIVEIRNLSKLAVTLTNVALSFSKTGAGTSPCTILLPQPVAVEPAGAKIFTLVANKDVLRCIPHPVTKQASVITARELARMTPTQQSAVSSTLHTADVSHKMHIGKHNLSDKTAWYFMVE
jgi:hypothetical protein